MTASRTNDSLEALEALEAILSPSKAKSLRGFLMSYKGLEGFIRDLRGGFKWMRPGTIYPCRVSSVNSKTGLAVQESLSKKLGIFLHQNDIDGFNCTHGLYINLSKGQIKSDVNSGS